MSIVVPEEVRRLFQVLTGEDMTDADEDALLAVGEALVSGAGAVEGLTEELGEMVSRVRGEFSGKAADRFAERVGGFGGVLEVSGGVLRGLGVFVRDVGWQVKYLKFVTVGGLVVLLGEIAWAVAMAGATGGASLAWLAARVAVMRFVLSRWWGQLFMRLAMCAGVGVGLNVLPDVVAQGVLVSEGKEGWSAGWTRDAAGVGAMSAMVGLPMSALGNVVGKTVARMLVAGLGDQVDRELLEAAARRAVEEHAELYPVSGLARFADVVAEAVDSYAGMSVRGLWAARFGRGLGESVEEGLTEMVGELVYGVVSGQGVQFNPFSFTAGVSESVASGAGRLAGLVLRGELIPPGTRYRDESAAEAEKTPLLSSDSELETVDGTGFSDTGGGVGGFRAGEIGMGDGKTGLAEDKGTVPGVEGGAAEGKDRVPRARVVSSSAGSAGVSHSGVMSADGRSASGQVEEARPTNSVGTGPGTPDGSVDIADGVGIHWRSGDSQEVTSDRPVRGESTATNGHVDGGVRGVEDGKTAVTEKSEDFRPAPHSGAVGTEVPVTRGEERPDTPPPPYSPATPDAEHARPGTPPPAYSPAAGDVEQVGHGAPPPVRGGDTPPVFTPDSAGDHTGHRPSDADTIGVITNRAQRDDPVDAGRGTSAGTAHGSGRPQSPALSTTSRVPHGQANPDGLPGPSAAVPVSAEAVLRDLPDVEAVPVADAAVAGSGVRGEPVAGSVAQWSVRDLRREIERAWGVDGPRESALLVVQHTHDVTKLVGHELVSVDEVVELVAARHLEHGVVEARRFSRDLAAWLGTEGDSLTVRAAAGAGSSVAGEDAQAGADVLRGSMAADPLQSNSLLGDVDSFAGIADSQPYADDPLPGMVTSDPLEPDHERALLAWAESTVDTAWWLADSSRHPSGSGRGEPLAGQADDALAAGRPVAGAEAVAVEGFGNDPDGLSFAGDLGTWSFDPLTAGQPSGFGWDETSGDHMAGTPAVAAEWSVDDPVRLPLAGDAGDSGVGGRSGRKRGRVDDSDDEGGGSERPLGRPSRRLDLVKQGRDVEAVWSELRRADQAGDPHTGKSLAAKFGMSVSWGYTRLAEFRKREGGVGRAELMRRERESELERMWAELRRARDAGELPTGESLAEAFGKSVSWGYARIAQFRASEVGDSAPEVPGSGSDRPTEGALGVGVDVVAAERSGVAAELSGAERAVAESSAQGETAESGAALGSFVVAVEIVRGTHDVVRLAREGALAKVVEQVEESLRTSGRAEASRFSRELAARLGSQGTGLAVRAGAGSDSPGGAENSQANIADSAAAVDESASGLMMVDPFGSGPGRDLLEWAESTGDVGSWTVDPSDFGPSLGFGWDVVSDGRPDDVSGADLSLAGADDVGSRRVDALSVGEGVGRDEVSGGRWDDVLGADPSVADVVAGEGFADAPSGLSFADDPDWWSVDPSTLGESWGFGWRGVSGGRTDDVLGAGPSVADADVVAGEGFADASGGLSSADEGDGSVGENSGRKRRRVDGAGDEGVASERPPGPRVPRQGARKRMREAEREAAWAELCRAQEAGEPHNGATLAKKFGKGRAWAYPLLAEFREREGGVDWLQLAQKDRDAGLEAVWVELRRARAAGESHTGESLGTRFGKGSAWGRQRLAEFRRRDGGTPPVQSAAAVREAELEKVWAEVRRAREAGDPHTGKSLAKVFGKSAPWGAQRLAELRAIEGDVSRSESAQRQRDAVWVELRRAGEAGESHTGESLGKKFGKSKAWGYARLGEFRRREGGTTQAQLIAQARHVVLEAVWAEVRRAREAGEPHTGASLATKFEKSETWGKERLAEFRRREGGTPQAQSVSRAREEEFAEVWTEVRRAHDAGEPHTGKSLGNKFEKSASWGRVRLAEFRRREGGTPQAQSVSRAREEEFAEVWTEVRRAHDAGEPRTGKSLGNKFEKSASWGRVRLAEFRSREGGGSAFAASEGGMPAETESAESASVAESPGQGEPADVSSGWRDVAVGIVRGTHDVVRLAREGSLDDVVYQVAERVREFGREEALRFCRELAARLGSQGTGFAIRAGAGPDSPAGGENSQMGVADSLEAADVRDGLVTFDPIESGPGRALLGWAESADDGGSWSVDPSSVGQPFNFGWDETRAVQPDDALPEGMSVAGTDPAVAEWFAGDSGGLSSDWEAGSWSVDPLGFGPSLGLGWDAAQGGHTVAEGVWGPGAEVVAAEWYSGDSGGYSSAVDAGGLPALGGTGGLKRRRVDDSDDEDAKPARPSGWAVTNAVAVKRKQEVDLGAVWAELRRADEAGQVHSGESLGRKFGKGSSWGLVRLREFRGRQGGKSRAEGVKLRREAVWAEMRRARDAGRPYTGVTLGRKFRKGASWGYAQLSEFRASEGGVSRAEVAQRERDAERDAVWAEVRRADAAGESHTGAALGAKFGKSSSWGEERLAEAKRLKGVGSGRGVPGEGAVVAERLGSAAGLSSATAAMAGVQAKMADPGVLPGSRDVAVRPAREEGTSRADAEKRKREEVWAEVRRARDAGEPHSGRSLGNRFGRSASWGVQRLAEFRRREGEGSPADVLKQQREEVWAELRRARSAGEPHTGKSLGAKFRRSTSWGLWQLDEFRKAENGSSEAEPLTSGSGAPAEGSPTADAIVAERSGLAAERSSAAAMAETGVQGETAESGVLPGSRDVAAGIVRGTHDVVRLARAGVLDEVVDRVATRLGESGRAEALRFSRELAATLGSQGTGLAVRAGAGPDSPEDTSAGTEASHSADADPVSGSVTFEQSESQPGHAVPEWADPMADAGAWSADPLRIERSLGFEWNENLGGQRDNVLAAGPSDSDVLAADWVGDDRGGLSSVGQVGSWPFDPFGVGQSFDFGWDEVQAGRAGDVLAAGASVPGADVVATGWFANDPSGWPSMADAGELASAAEGSGSRRRRVADSDDESERPSGPRAPRGNAAKRTRAVEPEEVWAEVRRADEAGEPHTGQSLGTRFGKSNWWGKQRLKELREREGEAGQADVAKRERAALLEEVRAEVRRADEAGGPHTGESLGAKFGMRKGWGYKQLRMFRQDSQELRRSDTAKWEPEEVWAELRRADAAGEPHTGQSLGAKFGKSNWWGRQRLKELREREGALSRAELVQQKRDAEREKVWAELRRADAAGEPHTGTTLAAKFGKSAPWGRQRLAEFSRREGGTTPAQLVAGSRNAGLEPVWAELRRADEAGEPHSGATLAKAFRKSSSWGYARLAEFRAGEQSMNRVARSGREAQGVADSRATADESMGDVAALDLFESEPARALLDWAESAGDPGSWALDPQIFGPSNFEWDEVPGGRTDDLLAAESGLDVLAAEELSDVPGGSAALSESGGREGARVADSGDDATEQGRPSGRRASRAGAGQRMRGADLGAVWAEASRALDEGEPHTGPSLAAKFKKSNAWGYERLAEFRERAGNGDPAEVAKRERDAKLEPVWAEVRRAEAAGQPHSGSSLGAKFGKSKSWGKQRLKELSEREGNAGRAEVAKRERAAELERVWAEVRRAEAAGDCHTGVSLARKFGKSQTWGLARLAEFRKKFRSGSGLQDPSAVGMDMVEAERSAVVTESSSADVAVSGPSTRGNAAKASLGPRDVAVGVVRRTHDVVRLARDGVLDEVLEQVAEQVRGFGRAEALRFSRELAERLGSRGTALTVRAGAGSDSSAGAEESSPGGESSAVSAAGLGGFVSADPLESEPARALLGWAESVGEVGWGDPASLGQAWGLGWGELQGGQAGEMPAQSVGRGDVVAAGGFAGDVGGLSSVDEGSRRKRGRVAEPDDEDAESQRSKRSRGPGAGEVWAELRRAEEAGEPHTGKSLAGKYGKSRSWGVDRLAVFRKGAAERKTDPKEVWAEVRRADQAGEPHTGPSLAAKFGKGKSWGWEHLREFRKEEVGVVPAELAKREREAELERVWAELRRARDAGEPHNGETLRIKFGRSLRWADQRLAEFKRIEGGVSRADVTKREAELERVWAELRRARDAGETHTGESLGKAFNKSGSWGLLRLAEFRKLLEGGLSRAEEVKREREAELEPVWAELRRADGAGQPHSGKSLAAKFGKSRSWGDHRLVEFREREGGASRGDAVKRNREAVWAELRRARDAGETHTGETLGKAFKKSSSWGTRRLAEFRSSERGGSVPETSAAGVDVVGVQRSGLVSELVGLVGSLRGLLVGAPVGYEPGLRARVEEWWVRLGRGELGGADVGNLRRRVSQAAALVERVRADRLGWGVGGSAVEGQPAAGVVEAGSSGLVSGVSTAEAAGSFVHATEDVAPQESTRSKEAPSEASGPVADSGAWPIDPASVDWSWGAGVGSGDETGLSDAVGADTAHRFGAPVWMSGGGDGLEVVDFTGDAKAGLTSRCHAAAASLRRLSAVAPPEYRAVVSRQIVRWLNIASGLSYRRADVVGLREQADAQARADVELGELVELDGAASAVLEEGRGVYGDEAVDGLLLEAAQRLGSTLGEVPSFRRVIAHQLLRDRDDVAAVDALRRRLSGLMATALGVSAGAGPVGGGFLPRPRDEVSVRAGAEDSDVDGVVSEDEWDRLRERLDRLRVSGDRVVGVRVGSADSPGLDGFPHGNDSLRRLSWPGVNAVDKPISGPVSEPPAAGFGDDVSAEGGPGRVSTDDDGTRRRSSWPGASDFNGNQRADFH
ncbi:WXG100-like domain-containing protein [Saccharopolyspora phatthalungensis]|uniref:DNA-binding transcriptional regulator YdaS (Cro superfamily) n=1 Tax=Saccharopolyspora phatthalungensis TaxID=664693 RepID=A0A840QIS2_9PSEU|nr:hypothetical protein [Saccharopolyspora phatthalungensis]MBB5160070.1 DNA-binding transcriptional regulator YdaS (Cro superfamily) [Saccharopolyspora phatthalungensis]